ncbi:MAG TPA: alpha/beta hydrolase [Alphaproteobacteria bacterium]|jgi:pimeloyl-ACP methyl ester carboxylesterase|nr:MAG: alpha/beta hydrolase [SAR116 cluster bacterium MED-G06]RPG87044.1 MAG: alpha/beta hydrolase [Candidatus Puniceispirillum sp. TMED245]HCV88731.1 alpha/beta hydrolase [Alphaproteobacteria bacterium]|tara:strand:+ start:7257 stop:8051 length:795 start_codon:yes stop_codon:yes gene_type:complete
MKHELHGDTIHIATGGLDFDATKPVLVFIHGSGQSHLTWVLQTRYFAHRGFSVLAPDLPGHGLSGGTPLASIETMADWINDLLDSLGAQTATLIGHSQGVLVALEGARRHPHRVSALGLIAGAMAIPVNDALIEMSQSAPAKAFRMMTSWGHGPGAHKFDNTQPGHAFLGYGRQVMAQNDDAALHADLVACNSYGEGETAAAALAQPTLCLIAGKDKMTPAKFGRKMAASISGAELQIFDRAGHFLPAEYPIEVNDALAAFLAR